MHEVAIMQGIVRAVLAHMQQAGASRVTHVQIIVGASGHFTADAVYQHFAVLTKGTPIEGASLSIQWLPAKYQCFSCLYRFESCEPSEAVTCPRCGEIALEIEHLENCFVSSMDVSFEGDSASATELPVQMLEELMPVSPFLSKEHAVPAGGKGPR